MREIKFRVWDKQRNIPIFFDSLSQLQLVTRSSPYYNLAFWDNSVIQQFTGLLDKNKKEIYEGDILLLPDEYTEKILDDGTGPTEPDNHIAEVKFLDADAAFGVMIREEGDFARKGFVSFSLLENENGTGYISKECEVIGNIFENPELLK